MGTAGVEGGRFLYSQHCMPCLVSAFAGEPLDLVLHLEEQRDVPEEASVITQTDVFLPRPASPKYVPKKTGVRFFCFQSNRWYFFVVFLR